MYFYVENKTITKQMRNLSSKLLRELRDKLKHEVKINTQIRIVGSGSHNLVTRNGDENPDVDYNLLITNSPNYDGRWVKETVRETFNKVLNDNGLRDCQDSKSVLTVTDIPLSDADIKLFSMDLGIVTENDKTKKMMRLVHFKTGYVQADQYSWEEIPDSDSVKAKEEAIKKAGCWAEVRDRYLELKNMYLRNMDYDHPSYVVYIETINEVYSKIGSKTQNKKTRHISALEQLINGGLTYATTNDRGS